MSPQLLKKVLYWLCLVIAPVILVTIELYHPAGFTKTPGMFTYLSIANHDAGHKVPEYLDPNWWFIMHMIQTPMVGLVAVGLVLLVWSVKEEDGLIPYLAALLTKVSAFLMIIYYTVLDSIGGIGLAKTIQITNALAASDPLRTPHHLTPDQVNGVAMVLDSTWGQSLGWRRWLGHKSFRILAGVLYGGFGRDHAAYIEEGHMAPLNLAGGIWMGDTNHPCQLPWPDRIWAAGDRFSLDVVSKP